MATEIIINTNKNDEPKSISSNEIPDGQIFFGEIGSYGRNIFRKYNLITDDTKIPCVRKNFIIPIGERYKSLYWDNNIYINKYRPVKKVTIIIDE